MVINQLAMSSKMAARFHGRSSLPAKNKATTVLATMISHNKDSTIIVRLVALARPVKQTSVLIGKVLHYVFSLEPRHRAKRSTSILSENLIDLTLYVNCFVLYRTLSRYL